MNLETMLLNEEVNLDLNSVTVANNDNIIVYPYLKKYVKVEYTKTFITITLKKSKEVKTFGDLRNVVINHQ